jgi:phage head maturation protease
MPNTKTRIAPAAVTPENPVTLAREFAMQAKAADSGGSKNRTYTLSFSSEDPYNRWFGPEILDHSAGCCDLTRLNDIGVLLFNHDADRVCGKINKAWTESNRNYAEVEFDTDEDADTIFQKVASGTLKGVSVGYRVTVYEEVTAGATSSDGRFAGPCYIAKKWEPLEVSIVSVPADATVGVGRSEELPSAEDNIVQPSERQVGAENNEKGVSKMPETKETKSIPTAGAEAAQTPAPATAAAPAIDIDAVTNEARAAERTRIAEISEICRSAGIEAQDYITKGNSVDEVRKAALDAMIAAGTPASVGAQRDEGEKFRAAAADGLAMRAGLHVDKPADGAADFRGMSLRDIAIETLTREGQQGGDLIRMDKTRLYDTMCRQFFNPAAAFPAILDQTINKTIVQVYNSVPTTFQAWTSTGSLSDFKSTADHRYLIGGVGDFLLVPENGEIKADIPGTDLLPSRKLDTYGKQFSMSRQAFIDDDIGFLTEIPGLYAAAAKKTIDKQVYKILFNNPKIYDNTALFATGHKNLISTGAAPSQATIQSIILQAQKQTDPFGDPIYMTPRFLVVPMGYEFALAVIFGSTQITGSDQNDINPLYNYPLQVVQTPVLNALAGSAACPWFMVTDPTSARCVQVDYLNGNEMPITRRMEAPGVLGFTWDMYLDWGVSVVDFRGIYKNPGATLV